MAPPRPLAPAGHGQPAPAAASGVAAGRRPRMSLAALLHQLQASAGSSSCASGLGGCVQRLRDSAASIFCGLSLDAIPANLLVVNDIAGVVDRVQQAVRAGAAAQPGGVQDAWVVLQDVEGLLQLTAQPVLWQVLGCSQQGQDLVQELLRCRRDLRSITSTASGTDG